LQAAFETGARRLSANDGNAIHPAAMWANGTVRPIDAF
jgi:hypothetical protein